MQLACAAAVGTTQRSIRQLVTLTGLQARMQAVSTWLASASRPVGALFAQEDHDGEQEPTRFECFWIPLEAAHIPQSGQGALLGRLFG
ncbi:hypothetical protein [Streptomyces fragilis]|uniref:Uncharacterized protein n=1 Tax=Streptomyces fragilis TaxID=67301 RepID=A0ABV2YC84_9ACTN|nr:hypothetical protein [Streptomyces fragilis]